MKARIALQMWRVPETPGAIEKAEDKDLLRPYQEPTQVSQGEKPKACWVTGRKGNRQNRAVSSVESLLEVLNGTLSCNN